jgi:hypothetical protein
MREAGFIDDDGRIHDWQRYAGGHFVQRAKDREKKNRQRHPERYRDVPGTSRLSPSLEGEGEREGERDLSLTHRVESARDKFFPENEEQKLFRAYAALLPTRLIPTEDRLKLITQALQRWTAAQLAESIDGYAGSPFWRSRRAAMPTFEALFRDETGQVERGLKSRRAPDWRDPNPGPRPITTQPKRVEPDADNRARGAQALAQIRQSLPWRRPDGPNLESEGDER